MEEVLQVAMIIVIGMEVMGPQMVEVNLTITPPEHHHQELVVDVIHVLEMEVLEEVAAVEEAGEVVYLVQMVEMVEL